MALELTPLAVMSACAAVAAASYAWNSYQERKRREALCGVAVRLGLDFEESDYSLDHSASSRLPLFNHGHSRAYKNIMRGKPDGTSGVILCDYRDTTGWGSNKTTHSQTVAVLNYARGGLPDFELRPENVLHKLGTLFGYQDIDFPESPAFSQGYLLRGKGEEAIRRLFGLNLRQFFEAHPGWSVEGGFDCLAVYLPDKLVAPEAFPAFLDEVRLLLWAFPR